MTLVPDDDRFLLFSSRSSHLKRSLNTMLLRPLLRCREESASRESRASRDSRTCADGKAVSPPQRRRRQGSNRARPARSSKLELDRDRSVGAAMTKERRRVGRTIRTARTYVRTHRTARHVTSRRVASRMIAAREIRLFSRPRAH